MDAYGLTVGDLQKLNDLFSANTKIERVILYGSRAKGNNRSFSDVDITLLGETLLNSDLSKLQIEIDDLLLPYKFDISLFKNLRNEALIEHINRVGKVLYTKE